MTKPNQFRKTYIVSCDVPYRNTSEREKGTHTSEGTLQRGRVVWLENDPQSAEPEMQVPAYAEGVGVVLVTATAVQPVR